MNLNTNCKSNLPDDNAKDKSATIDNIYGKSRLHVTSFLELVFSKKSFHCHTYIDTSAAHIKYIHLASFLAQYLRDNIILKLCDSTTMVCTI